MKKLRGKVKTLSFTQIIAFVTLFLLLGAIFVTINSTLQQQALRSSAAALPVGSALPSETDCAAKIVKTPENIPENQAANNTKASGALSGSPLGTYNAAYQSRVTGNFAGTTDEILQWGACKWGFDADTARAIAAGLSKWKQSALADCNNQGQIQPETNGCQSVGIMRIKAANIPPTHGGTWPNAKTSTAFNVDYALGVIRACYEGKQSSLTSSTVAYQAGDLNGCIGAWYSGAWHDGAAEGFILGVEDIQRTKEWTTYGGGTAAAPGGTSGAQTIPNNPAGVVTPSFYPLAPCPTCSSPSTAPVVSVVVAPTGSTTYPTTVVESPASATDPCVTNNSIAEDNKHKGKHKKHSGKLSGGIEVIFQFLIKLLELLIQILGGGQIANPTPPTTPGEPQEPVPCTPTESPLPAPSASSEPVPSVLDVVPSSVVTVPSVSPGPSPEVSTLPVSIQPAP